MTIKANKDVLNFLIKSISPPDQETIDRDWQKQYGNYSLANHTDLRGLNDLQDVEAVFSVIPTQFTKDILFKVKSLFNISALSLTSSKCFCISFFIY